MKQHPNDTIAWCARHESKNLGIVGVGRRKLAASKMKGLLRANGITPLGFTVSQTITLPGNRDAINHVCRCLYTRAEQRHPIFMDNRDSLMGEAIGTLVIYDLGASDADRLMSAVRADMNQYLAASAV